MFAAWKEKTGSKSTHRASLNINEAPSPKKINISFYVDQAVWCSTKYGR